MSSPHQAALETRHSQLDKAVAVEASRRAPNERTILTMKKEKLRLKDQIAGH